jgi:hypothetical protein
MPTATGDSIESEECLDSEATKILEISASSKDASNNGKDISCNEDVNSRKDAYR